MRAANQNRLLGSGVTRSGFKSCRGRQEKQHPAWRILFATPGAVFRYLLRQRQLPLACVVNRLAQDAGRFLRGMEAHRVFGGDEI